MKKFVINQKRKFIYLYLLIFLILLVISCSKNKNSSEQEKLSITGSVIEDAKENCRLSNESDCRPIEIRKGEQENEEANNTQETVNVEKNANKTTNISEEAVLSNCESGWKCVEAKYRAYQYSNCTWSSIESCVYGCKNDACKQAPICRPNYLKCDKDNVVKCDEDGFEWNLNESCDYQCENGICISKNETASNTTNRINATNSTSDSSSNSTYSSPQANVSYDCINVLKYNLTGKDPTDEYFTLKNSCSYQIDMSGWTASDDANHIYTFPSFNLASNGEVTIVTGSGINSQTTLYWGRGSAVWNNGGDTLYLNSSNGASVLIKVLNP